MTNRSEHSFWLARCLFALCSLWLCGESSSLLAAPHLPGVPPPGGRGGLPVGVDFVGRALDEPRSVLFYGPGITAESITMVTSIPGPNGKPQAVEPGYRVRAKL